MNKPSNYYTMDWSERQEWDRNQRAIEEAEYDAYRARQDAEDAQREAEQARQNYRRYAAAQAEEESYLIYDIESKDAQIEALNECLDIARLYYRGLATTDELGRALGMRP